MNTTLRFPLFSHQLCCALISVVLAITLLELPAAIGSSQFLMLCNETQFVINSPGEYNYSCPQNFTQRSIRISPSTMSSTTTTVVFSTPFVGPIVVTAPAPEMLGAVVLRFSYDDPSVRLTPVTFISIPNESVAPFTLLRVVFERNVSFERTRLKLYSFPLVRVSPSCVSPLMLVIDFQANLTLATSGALTNTRFAIVYSQRSLNALRLGFGRGSTSVLTLRGEAIESVIELDNSAILSELSVAIGDDAVVMLRGKCDADSSSNHGSLIGAVSTCRDASTLLRNVTLTMGPNATLEVSSCFAVFRSQIIGGSSTRCSSCIDGIVVIIGKASLVSVSQRSRLGLCNVTAQLPRLSLAVSGVQMSASGAIIGITTFSQWFMVDFSAVVVDPQLPFGVGTAREEFGNGTIVSLTVLSSWWAFTTAQNGTIALNNIAIVLQDNSVVNLDSSVWLYAGESTLIAATDLLLTASNNSTVRTWNHGGLIRALTFNLSYLSVQFDASTLTVVSDAFLQSTLNSGERANVISNSVFLWSRGASGNFNHTACLARPSKLQISLTELRVAGNSRLSLVGAVLFDPTTLDARYVVLAFDSSILYVTNAGGLLHAPTIVLDHVDMSLSNRSTVVERYMSNFMHCAIRGEGMTARWISLSVTGGSSMSMDYWTSWVGSQGNNSVMEHCVLCVDDGNLSLTSHASIFTISNGIMLNMSLHFNGNQTQVDLRDTASMLNVPGNGVIRDVSVTVDNAAWLSLANLSAVVYCDALCDFSDSVTHIQGAAVVDLSALAGWMSAVPQVNPARNIFFWISGQRTSVSAVAQATILSFGLIYNVTILIEQGSCLTISDGCIMMFGVPSTLLGVAPIVSSAAVIIHNATVILKSAVGLISVMFGRVADCNISLSSGAVLDLRAMTGGYWAFYAFLESLCNSGAPLAVIPQCMQVTSHIFIEGSTVLVPEVGIVPPTSSSAVVTKLVLSAPCSSVIQGSSSYLIARASPYFRVASGGWIPWSGWVARCGTMSLTATVAVPREQGNNAARRTLISTSTAFLSGAIGASFGGGPGSASTAVRAALSVRLLDCDSMSLDDSFDGNYLQVGFGSQAGYYVRGTVVGSLVGVMGCAMLCYLFALLLAWTKTRSGLQPVQQQQRRRTWRQEIVVKSGAEMSMPGWLIVPIAVVFQPLMGAALTLLIAPTEGGGGDVAIGIIGVVVGMATLVITILLTTVWFGATSRSLDDSAEFQNVELDHVTAPSWRRVLAFLTKRIYDEQWVDKDTGSACSFTAKYGSLFDIYRRNFQWYCVVELSVSTACGALQAAALRSVDDCERSLYALAVVQLLYFVGAVGLRPQEVRIELMMSVALAAFGAVFGVLVLVPHCDSCDAPAKVAAETQTYFSFAQIAVTLLSAAAGPLLFLRRSKGVVRGILTSVMMVMVHCRASSSTLRQIAASYFDTTRLRELRWGRAPNKPRGAGLLSSDRLNDACIKRSRGDEDALLCALLQCTNSHEALRVMISHIATKRCCPPAACK